MDRRTPPIVVIGASAGGVQALLALVAELPSDFPAAVLVVVHIGRGRSVLPTLLERSGVLPARHARNGELIERGRVYVAPPDLHLLVDGPLVRLSHGPRENHSRPAVDPLFRSAAVSCGSRTVGIILSGALSDGTVGLQMIKARGGIAIVQDPDEALVGGMPGSALRSVEADYILPARDIGRLLASDLGRLIEERERTAMSDDDYGARRTIEQTKQEQGADERDNQLTMYTCPDCGGTLWEVDAGQVPQFHCHVGHVWGTEALLGNKSVELESALWSGVRLFEERSVLMRQVASQIRETNGDDPRAEEVEEQARLDEDRAAVIRSVLESPLNRTLELVDTHIARADD